MGRGHGVAPWLGVEGLDAGVSGAGGLSGVNGASGASGSNGSSGSSGANVTRGASGMGAVEAKRGRCLVGLLELREEGSGRGKWFK